MSEARTAKGDSARSPRQTKKTLDRGSASTKSSRKVKKAANNSFRQELLAAITFFLPASLFARFAVRPDVRWIPRKIAIVAILMVWNESTALIDGFNMARNCAIQMFPGSRRVGATYQGFSKAWIKWSPRLLTSVVRHLRTMMMHTAGRFWTVQGWLAFAVDGSRIDLPRTKANEKAFGCGGKKKTHPQAWLTTIWHLGLGLPWAWKIGKADASERNHLRQMIPLLPLNCLLVADAGFTGYDLWRLIIDTGHAILIRVGSNVRLLKNLGYHYEKHGNIVYLWPKDKRDQEPLVLRLICLHTGKRPVYLITNVSNESDLSDQTAAMLYRMRWGIEVFYRSLKQILKRRKMRSEAPVQAALELRWSMTGLMLLGLMGVKNLMDQGHEPKALSTAKALRHIRTVMHHPSGRYRRGHSLAKQLGNAVKDTYQRRSSKEARDWPHIKKEKPAGKPKIETATPLDIAQALNIRARKRAA